MRCVVLALSLILASPSSFSQSDGDIVAARSAEFVARIADSHPRLLLRIQHLRPMIFAFDWAYGALTEEERATVSLALRERPANFRSCSRRTRR
jgi:hypothetical protein